MGAKTSIEWTDATVNFWWGCTKVGPGCDHCYAETLSARFGGAHWGVGAPRKKIKGAVKLLHRLDNDYSEWAADFYAHKGNAETFGWPAPSYGARRRVFIQSMSDIFDLEVPVEWFEEAWTTIERCARLNVQLVTKRISAVEKRLSEIGRPAWPKHAGLIVTVCNQAEADRDIPRLLSLKENLGIPWVGLSIEPMLGPMDIRRPFAKPGCAIFNAAGAQEDIVEPEVGIDWVICGGESGPGARPMHPDWARALRDQCAQAGVPFFFKQWGAWVPPELARDHLDFAGPVEGRSYLEGRWTENWALPDDPDALKPDMYRLGKKTAGRLLDGVTHDEMPA